MARRRKISVSIDGDILVRVEKMARASRQSISRCVDNLLRDSLDDAEMAVRVFSDPVLAGTVAKAFADRDFIRQVLTVMKEDVTDDQYQFVFDRLQNVARDAGAVHVPPVVEKMAKASKKKRGK